jgi:hypothetical protein
MPARARLRRDYDTSREDRNSPWFEALRGMVQDEWPMAASVWGWDDRVQALPYEPLAPLLRVVIYRHELMGRAPVVGLRRVLAALGDAGAVEGIDGAQPVDIDGFSTVAAAEARARIGQIEGVEALWRLLADPPKRPAWQRERQSEQKRAKDDRTFARMARRRVVESLVAVLDLGAGPARLSPAAAPRSRGS